MTEYFKRDPSGGTTLAAMLTTLLVKASSVRLSADDAANLEKHFFTAYIAGRDSRYSEAVDDEPSYPTRGRFAQEHSRRLGPGRLTAEHRVVLRAGCVIRISLFIP